MLEAFEAMLVSSHLLSLIILASAAAAAAVTDDTRAHIGRKPPARGSSLRSTVVSAVVGPNDPVPAREPAHPYPMGNKLDPLRSPTDNDEILPTVQAANQKQGADTDAPPGLPARKTTVTAMDGRLMTEELHSSQNSQKTTMSRRERSAYGQVFSGTGTRHNDRDGAIMGTAYLTYTVVPNSTYNVNACLDFCDRVAGCVFVNLYYEFNNVLLDFVFSEKSNLRCAAYAEVHSAKEKINLGGQQSLAPPAPLTYIQHSSGYASLGLTSPPVPNGYDISFGPLDGAINAPGYMGFALLDRYDVSACATLCNTREPDPVGGACQFFNIWRAVVKGVPTTYTCSMYYSPAGSDLATNNGQGDLRVTYSRGYRRRNAYRDAGFEGYSTCDLFCFVESSASWVGTSPTGGVLDATIFYYQPYSHSGHSVGLLGSATGRDALPGTISSAGHLNTDPGAKYTITFFLASNFSGPELEAGSFVEVIWNGVVVGTVRDGYSPWKYHSYTVTAIGSDTIAFRGGKAPAWTFIDDIFIFRTEV